LVRPAPHRHESEWRAPYLFLRAGSGLSQSSSPSKRGEGAGASPDAVLSSRPSAVMPGLERGIHVFAPFSPSCPALSRASTSFHDGAGEDVDGRDRPGHDDPPRHARPRAGHPRVGPSTTPEDVDGRDRPGHDGERVRPDGVPSGAAPSPPLRCASLASRHARAADPPPPREEGVWRFVSSSLGPLD